MSRIIVRMWTKEGYHKDVAILSEKQVHMSFKGMEPGVRHVVYNGPSGPRVVIDQTKFPEAVEFEVIVEDSK